MPEEDAIPQLIGQVHDVLLTEAGTYWIWFRVYDIFHRVRALIGPARQTIA